MKPSDIAQQEMQGDKGEWTFADLSDFAVMLTVVSGFAGLLGYWVATDRHETEARRAAEAPRPAAIARPAIDDLFPCTKEGFREYRRVCWHRVQSEATKRITTN